ncbi:ggdef family protein, partial [Vibrio cholerae]
MLSSFKVAENHQVSMLQCCWMFNTGSLVSKKAASSLNRAFFVGNAVSGQLNLDRCKF